VSADVIQTELVDGVLTLRLNRPEKRNAMSRAMYASLADHLEAARSDDAIRVLLLAGSQECFTSGGDLKDGPIEGLDGPLGRFMRGLALFPKPVVAAPCGLAVGIGVTLLLHCDLVYAGEQTTFRLPFVALGVCPEFASSFLLPRLAGHLRASELLLTGEAFDATAAREAGLVNETLPNDQLEEYARARAAYVAAQPPRSVRMTKQLLKRARSPGVLDAIEVEMEHLLRLQQGAEAREALAAFQARQRPNFADFR